MSVSDELQVHVDTGFRTRIGELALVHLAVRVEGHLLKRANDCEIILETSATRYVRTHWRAQRSEAASPPSVLG